MGRERGTFQNPANYEPLIAAPFDARALVETKADLILASTWTTPQGEMWIYNGMITVVYNDAENNGLYILFDRSAYDKESSWIKTADYAAIKKWVDELLALEEKIENTYTKAETHLLFDSILYDITAAPDGTLVDNSREKELRVMCPADTQWKTQESGEGADSTLYYIGFRAFAPTEEVVSFKEDLQQSIGDDTMYYFENNDFAGIDEYGRKYSIVWLPVAQYNATSDSWFYYGASSSAGRYIGWYYSVEWYDVKGALIGADTIRINLSNEKCHTWIEPYYMGQINVNRLVQTDTDTVVLFGGTATGVN